MDIWFKVMEKSWKSHGNPLVKMCKNPVISKYSRSGTPAGWMWSLLVLSSCLHAPLFTRSEQNDHSGHLFHVFFLRVKCCSSLAIIIMLYVACHPQPEVLLLLWSVERHVIGKRGDAVQPSPWEPLPIPASCGCGGVKTYFCALF